MSIALPEETVSAAMVALLPLSGCLYANVKTPLDTNFASTDLGSKAWKSEARSILGIWTESWVHVYGE